LVLIFYESLDLLRDDLRGTTAWDGDVQTELCEEKEGLLEVNFSESKLTQQTARLAGTT